MKTYKYIIFCLCTCVFVSCSGFLDEESKGFVSPDTFYETEEDIDAALNSVYLGPHERYSSLWGATSWFEWATDECELTTANGHAYHNQPSYLTTTFNASSDMPWAFWDCMYRYIKNCNFLLANIGNVSMNETKREQVIAQTRAFRALYYFDLVRVYNDVPLILEPIDDAKVANSKTRDAAATVYDAIEKDLLYAIEKLPISWTDGRDGGRLTKGSAAGLLARVYLTWYGYPLKDASKLDKAKTILENFIEKKEYGSQYGLFDTYGEAFLEQNIPGKESVWTINFTRSSYGQGSDFHTNLAPIELYYASGIGLTRGGGWSNGLPTDKFLESYDKVKDKRYEFSYWSSTADIPEEYSDVNPPIVFAKPHCKKFREPTPNDNSLHTGIDHYIIRYADILLMYAEVLNESGDSRCYTYLNMVRNRAGLDDFPATDKNSFLNHLMVERAWEFAFEGDRKFDLVRWDAYYDRVKAWNPQAGPNVIKGKHEFWPIPQRERDINKALTQNNGF